MHTHIYLSMYIYIYIRMYVHIIHHMHLSLSIYIYIHIHTYIYIYTCIYTSCATCRGLHATHLGSLCSDEAGGFAHKAGRRIWKPDTTWTRVGCAIVQTLFISTYMYIHLYAYIHHVWGQRWFQTATILNAYIACMHDMHLCIACMHTCTHAI